MFGNTAGAVLTTILIGYALGCLSPSFLIGKLHGIDVRVAGSGNAGASNTVIMVGKMAGLTVALLDILKAATAWWLCQGLFPGLEVAGPLAGTAAILGHIFPVYFGFKGGKGVSVGLTIAFAACWQTGVFALAAFGITVLISKKVSLGSLMGCVGGLIAVFLFAPNPLRIWMTLIAALIIVARHSANIRRLAEGKESNFHFADEKEKEADQSDKSV